MSIASNHSWVGAAGHAYSLLDVREVGHAVVGEQPRITTFLRSSTSPIKKRSLLRSCKAGEPRLKQPRMGRQTQMLLPSRERTLPALFSAVVSSGWVCSLCTFKNHGKEKRGVCASNLIAFFCRSKTPPIHLMRTLFGLLWHTHICRCLEVRNVSICPTKQARYWRRNFQQEYQPFLYRQ